MPYTAPPQRWDHDLLAGDTYQPAEVQLVDSNGTAYSLAGVTGAAQLKAIPGGAVVLTPTVTVTDAANGRFTWSASAASTATLVPGEYGFGIRLTWPDTTVRTVLEGTVRVRPPRVG